MTGANSAVTDVECLNCFNAIRAIRAARHYIARVQGQPTNIVRTVEIEDNVSMFDVSFLGNLYRRELRYWSR